MARLVRYLISGGISTGVNLAVLYVCTEWLGLWYLASACIAFFVGFLVSFTLQKFWTFKSAATDRLVSESLIYFLIVLVNFGINALGLYLLVEQLHVWYLLAEFGMLALIACESFFLYRLLFRSNTTNLPARADSV